MHQSSGILLPAGGAARLPGFHNVSENTLLQEHTLSLSVLHGSATNLSKLDLPASIRMQTDIIRNNSVVALVF